MKILIYCRNYLPLIGGLPIRMRVMAEQFSAAGHEVCVVTATPGNDVASDEITTYRGIGFLKLHSLCREQDVILSANISLNSIFPMLLSRTPVFVAHGGGYFGRWSFDVVTWAKLWACRQVNNIYCSHAVSEWIGAPGTVLPNTYRSEIFKLYPNVKRNNDIVCFGRLVSDKGFFLMVDALQVLVKRGEDRSLTVVGDGPEEDALRQHVADCDLTDRVVFTGQLLDQELAKTLASHAVAVIPSLWEEPFGNVALEALGCGCKVVVSDGGGLPDAAGGCGIVFKRGDVSDLAAALVQAQNVDTSDPHYQAELSQHLTHYRPDNVAEAYLSEFQKVASMPVRSRVRTNRMLS